MEEKVKVGVVLTKAAKEYAEHHNIRLSSRLESILAEEMGNRISLPTIRMKVHGHLGNVKTLIREKHLANGDDFEYISEQLGIVQMMIEAMQGDGYLTKDWKTIVSRRGLE